LSEARTAQTKLHALAHEGVAQFDQKQIALRRLAAVRDRVQQRGIEARQPGQHPRIGPVALAFVGGDGAPLARVGHEDFQASSRQPPAHPRAVRADFQRRAGQRIIRGEPIQRARSIGDGEFLEDVCVLIEDADGVFPVAEVDAEGECWNGVFHKIAFLSRNRLARPRGLLI
jgi:hypothetical protein